MDEGYDPEWLALEAAMGQRPVLHGDANDLVTQYNTLGDALTLQWGPGSGAVEERDEKINEHVTVRIYTPKELAGKKLPVGIYAHGGGWQSGNLVYEGPMCRFVAENTPCVIVSVDYRLAPSWKLPTGIYDTYDALIWARENATKLNGDLEDYFLIGGSAGAAVALSVTELLVRKLERDFIRGTVVMNAITSHWSNPPAKYKDIYTSYTEYETGAPVIDKHCMEIACAESEAQPTDSLVFTAISENHAKWPPVYMASSEKDILRDDSLVLEKCLQDAGVKVKHDHYKGYPHYFWVFPSLAKSNVFFMNVVKGLQWVLGRE